jgi:hypothetical protein
VRGCLVILVLAVVVALGGAWFGGPALAGVLVESALDASGFEARTTSVRVTSNPPFAVLTGQADRVDITAEDATFRDLVADGLDLALLDVDLLGRSFGEVEGIFTGARVNRPEGGSVEAEEVSLTGPAANADAVVTIAGSEVERVAVDALEDGFGVTPKSATLTEPDLLTFEVAGNRVEGRFVVDPDGALSLAAQLPGNPRVELIEGDPLRLESATVVDDTLVLTGSIDVAALLP